MAWQYAISTNSQVNLGTTDSVYVGQYVTIGVSSSNQAIYGTGSDQTAIIDGTVAGYNSVALGNDSSVASNETVEISKTGNLFSGGPVALAIYAFSSTISNAGTIHGGVEGIYLFSTHSSGSSTITNSGLVDGGSSYGVIIRGSQAVHLTNTGTIEGGTYSFFGSDGTNDNRIVNEGRMIGAIFLGNGDSIYDGRHGHVSGTVDGGGRGDRIYGGTEDNTFIGGAGADFLWGGKGADTLTGGTAADTFILATGDGKDEITDFNRAEGDSIDIHNWKAIDTFSNLKSHAKNHGDDVWITSGHDTLVIDGMHINQLMASDFHF